MPPTAVACLITIKSPSFAPWLLSVTVIVVESCTVTKGLLKLVDVFLNGVISYKTPELNHKDHYAVEMLAMLLSQGNSSRFNKRIVEQQEKAMFAAAFPFPLEDRGVAITFALANMGVEIGDL